MGNRIFSRINICIPCIIISCATLLAYAGNLDSPDLPLNPNSAMYTLEDIYNRLDDGSPGFKKNGDFAKLDTDVASTYYTLDEIMGKMPSPDNTTGATTDDVIEGKSFWGLTSDEWGMQTGTAKPPDYPAMVPRTGQTTSYKRGDDGDLQIGVPWPDPRFTDHGDGTVTDNLTGLMWTKDAYANSNNWTGAINYCNNLSLAGYDDWRLPNLKELLSLVDYSKDKPALPDGHPFINVQHNAYWSSTSYIKALYFEPGIIAPCTIDFYYLGDFWYSDKESSNSVWPVRGGE